MESSYYAENLKLLCARYPSVAEVCRKLDINRQQFNKYLNGQVLPSKFNQKRICEFFNVSLTELHRAPPVPAGNLSENSINRVGKVEWGQAFDTLPNSVEKLERYVGYYHGYYHSLGFPGALIRNLFRIYPKDGQFYCKNIEHLWHKDRKDDERSRFKYEGVVFYLADRIFILEAEKLVRNSICETILYPSYRSTLKYISGITLGVGSLHTHEPKSARVEYQYLGKEIDLRAALSSCGLFPIDSPMIDSKIKSRIENKIDGAEYTLNAVNY